jgi:hypothetical protein
MSDIESRAQEITVAAGEYADACVKDAGVVGAFGNLIGTIRRVLAELSPQWLPIETAPKDGSAILVFPGVWSGIPCGIAGWDEDQYAKKPRPYWRRIDVLGRTSLSRDNPPTHWMPLPDPHTIDGKEAK